MVGPGPRTYMWLDDKGKKSKLSAPQYVDYVMTYVQKVVNDETVFPTKHGNEFPANFESVLKKVQKLLFHVVAHIYHSHFREVSTPSTPPFIIFTIFPFRLCYWVSTLISTPYLHIL